MIPLCIAAIEDDHDRFFMEQLYYKYQRLMYSVIQRYTRDPWDADDIFQSTLPKLIDKLTLLKTLKRSKLTRKQKTAYIGKIQQLLSGGFSNLSDQTCLCLREREKALTEYRDKMKDTPRLTNAKESIIASVIHMFCNRLTGERSLEQKYLNIIREALSNIVEKERRLAKKEF